jgi:methionine synthase II (cobalamin-independent)
MASSRPPFRADHVGSLLRPPGLKALRLAREAGTVGATLEKKDDLKRRLDEASRYIALDQVCVSPQCGFSSTVEGNDVAVEEERAKLSLCVELAREVRGSL